MEAEKSNEPTVEVDKPREPTLVVAELSIGSGNAASLQAMAVFLKERHPTFKIVVCLPSPFLKKVFLNQFKNSCSDEISV